MCELARRGRDLHAAADRIDTYLQPLLEATAPDLLGICGVGVDGAAMFLVTAGDNPGRLRSEAAWAHLCGVAPIPASSGKTIRYANAALHRVVLCRMSGDARTKTYVAKRRLEGKTNREIIRSLERYVAREVYRHLPHR